MTSVLRRLLLPPLVLAGLLVASTEVRAVVVGLWPATASVRAGAQQRFFSYVWKTPNKSVVWAVNGVIGGNAILGRVSPDGLYTAPATPPPGNLVTLSATSVADSRISESAAVVVLNPLPTVSSLMPPKVEPGPFTVAITGRGFVPGSEVRLGSAILATSFVSSTQLMARGSATAIPGGIVPIIVANPNPGSASSAMAVLEVGAADVVVSAAAAARFLEQVSWGPDPKSIARVQRMGFNSYLDQQFAMPSSTFPDYPTAATTLDPVQRRFLLNATTGADQLRQRVAFALLQIVVVSGMKVHTPEQFVPYLRLLHAHAFDNYATLLREVTLSPSMGKFLDMVYSEKASSFLGSSSNENYGRELLQLFTIGTDRLNLDGTPQLDGGGRPIATFDQSVVEGFSRAFTGWTYPTKPGAAPQIRNPPYFVGRMERVAATHDIGEKTLLDGAVLSAGQTPEQDLDDALANVFAHPNVGPFVARRLIQHFVTSNPSPAYVARIAAVFNANSVGVRGDLRSVIKAIVLDPEARQGDPPGVASSIAGHLREPLLYVLGLVRALGGTLSGTTTLAGLIGPSGQKLFYPSSVFNYFSALYDIPGLGLRGPEFQIQTPSSALYRANLAFVLAFGSQSVGAAIDLEPFEQLASEPGLLVEALNRALLLGRMPPEMRQTIEASISGLVVQMRARTALYLVGSSSQYQIQH